jgi:hypothetical protein
MAKQKHTSFVIFILLCLIIFEKYFQDKIKLFNSIIKSKF